MAVQTVNSNSLAAALLKTVYADTGTADGTTPGTGDAPDWMKTMEEYFSGKAAEAAAAAADAALGSSSPKLFSNKDPFGYDNAVQYIIKTYFGGDASNYTKLIGDFVNAWAIRLGEDITNSEGKVVDRNYPSFQTLIDQADFNSGAAMLQFAGVVPKDAYVITEGTPQNPTAVAHMQYDPMTGLHQTTVDPKTWFGAEAPGQFDIVTPQAKLPPGLLERLDPQAQAALTGQVVMTNAKNRKVTVGHPLMTQEQYLAILQQKQTPGPTGPQQPKIDFDRRKLAEAARAGWHQWLYSDPADPQINSIVDGYIKEATGFWRRGGGTLDFTAYLKEQLRKQPRYNVIFKYKPADQSEEDFVSSMAQPIGNLGLRADTTQTETARSLSSGGSPLGQLQRIAGTSEGMRATNFSQRFSATLQKLGVGARS